MDIHIPFQDWRFWACTSALCLLIAMFWPFRRSLCAFGWPSDATLARPLWFLASVLLCCVTIGACVA